MDPRRCGPGPRARTVCAWGVVLRGRRSVEGRPRGDQVVQPGGGTGRCLRAAQAWNAIPRRAWCPGATPCRQPPGTGGQRSKATSRRSTNSTMHTATAGSASVMTVRPSSGTGSPRRAGTRLRRSVLGKSTCAATSSRRMPSQAYQWLVLASASEARLPPGQRRELQALLGWAEAMLTDSQERAALYSLGEKCRDGSGVPQDDVLAYRFMDMAAQGATDPSLVDQVSSVRDPLANGSPRRRGEGAAIRAGTSTDRRLDRLPAPSTGAALAARCREGRGRHGPAAPGDPIRRGSRCRAVRAQRGIDLQPLRGPDQPIQELGGYGACRRTGTIRRLPTRRRS